MKNYKTEKSWLALALVAALLSGGCAQPLTHPLDTVAPDIALRPGSSIGLGVQDKREYIVDKEKLPSFVGLSRFNFGIPADIKTASGKPLSDDFCQVIKTALVKKGSKVAIVELPVGTDDAAAFKLVAGAGQKGLVLFVHEWKSDGFTNTWIEYDIQAMVVDSSGTVAATKRLVGRDNLGSPGNGAPDHARSTVPVALRKKIEELFAAPEIASNL